LNKKDITNLVEEAVQWVESQRGIHRPDSRVLSESERTELARFFEPETLNRARIRAVSMIERPGFFTILGDKGKADMLQTFNRMAGIAFADTIVVSRSQMPVRSQLLPLLFHELVHVVQYEVLGLRAFVELYVSGWAETGFSYHSIPLERDAYELQEQYEIYPRLSFSVTAEVCRRLGFP